MHQLNRRYRRQDRTTDVLSFSTVEDGQALSADGVLGDVVISVEQAARQAPAGDLEAELARLLAHGLCHLRGMDHQRQGPRRAMWAEEARLLEPLGLAPFWAPTGTR